MAIIIIDFKTQRKNDKKKTKTFKPRHKIFQNILLAKERYCLILLYIKLETT